MHTLVVLLQAAPVDGTLWHSLGLLQATQAVQLVAPPGDQVRAGQGLQPEAFLNVPAGQAAVQAIKW
jgi:hypothetical protein